MKKLFVTVALMASTAAFAWGPREQGIVTGVAGTLLYQHITGNQPQYNPPPAVYYPPAPVYPQNYYQAPVRTPAYYQPPPPVCTTYSNIDHHGQFRGHTRICR